MYCKYCGNKLTDDSFFCTSCGAKVSEENQQVVKVERIYVDTRTPEQIEYDSERGPWKKFARTGKTLGIISACIPFYGIIIMPLAYVFSGMGMKSKVNKSKAITGICFASASITNLILLILLITYTA